MSEPVKHTYDKTLFKDRLGEIAELIRDPTVTVEGVDEAGLNEVRQSLLNAIKVFSEDP